MTFRSLFSTRGTNHARLSGSRFGNACSAASLPHLCCILFAALPVVVATGCGKGGPVVEKVEGVVTRDGAPLEGATVLFSPAGGGLPAAGRTESGGAFRLATTMPGQPVAAGAAAGDYVVLVTKVETPPVIEVPTDHPDYGKAPMPTGAEKQPKIKYVVPQSYGDPKKSPLKATVKKGTNTFTFEIDSKAK